MMKTCYSTNDQYLCAGLDKWDFPFKGVKDAVEILERIFLTVAFIEWDNLNERHSKRVGII